MTDAPGIDHLQLSGGGNIALKIPAHLYDATLSFYRDLLGLSPAPSERGEIGFLFGESNQTLWIDRVEGTARPDAWLELRTADVDEARRYFVGNGIAIADHLEPLPPGYKGFWIINPAGLVHLVSLYGE